MSQAERISTTTRRGVLQGALATSTVAGAAVLPAFSRDADLVRLGEQLRTAWTLERKLEEDGSDGFEAAFEVCTRIVNEIEQYTATTMEGLRTKALAVLWCHSGDMTLEFGTTRTTDIRLAESIVRDLIG